jgi:photosystem II stability/assembly factor-like uncharacterized protein
MYKSRDAGKTWQHIGLAQNHGISAILVDPRDPNLVLAATLGDLRTKSDQRGVYRSSNGGRAWTKVLYKDDETGAFSIVWAFDNPKIVYATLGRRADAVDAAVVAHSPRVNCIDRPTRA